MSARLFRFFDDWKNDTLTCPTCGWTGTFDQGSVEYFDGLRDSSCPNCDTMLAILQDPTLEESEANRDKLSERDRMAVDGLKSAIARFDRLALQSPDQLPDIDMSPIVLYWDYEKRGFLDAWTHIKHEGKIIWTEPCGWEVYERFDEVLQLLMGKYGPRLVDLIPTNESMDALCGDRMGAWGSTTLCRRTVAGPDQLRSKVAHDTAVAAATFALSAVPFARTQQQVADLLSNQATLCCPFSVGDEAGTIDRWEFDEWHRDAILTMTAGDTELPISAAIVMLNHYLKTRAYLAGEGRPGLKDALHPCIDVDLLRGLWKAHPWAVKAARKLEDIQSYEGHYLAVVEQCRKLAAKIECLPVELDFWRVSLWSA